MTFHVVVICRPALLPAADLIGISPLWSYARCDGSGWAAYCAYCRDLLPHCCASDAMGTMHVAMVECMVAGADLGAAPGAEGVVVHKIGTAPMAQGMLHDWMEADSISYPMTRVLGE